MSGMGPDGTITEAKAAPHQEHQDMGCGISTLPREHLAISWVGFCLPSNFIVCKVILQEPAKIPFKKSTESTILGFFGVGLSPARSKAPKET